MNRWIETLAGAALVAMWLVVVWTADSGLQAQDRDDAARAAATEGAPARTATAAGSPRS